MVLKTLAVLPQTTSKSEDLTFHLQHPAIQYPSNIAKNIRLPPTLTVNMCFAIGTVISTVSAKKRPSNARAQAKLRYIKMLAASLISPETSKEAVSQSQSKYNWSFQICCGCPWYKWDIPCLICGCGCGCGVSRYLIGSPLPGDIYLIVRFFSTNSNRGLFTLSQSCF